VTLHDITPLVTGALAVWPGDTPPTREVLLDLARGHTVTLSTLHATVHLGAHADAPSHYVAEGDDIASRSLEPYLGACEVIHVSVARGTRVGVGDLPARISAPRVLLATGTYPDPNRFTEDFAGIEPEAIDHLADQGVILVGIDTPSVDLFASKDLPAHAACARRDLAILEGVVLSAVPPGVYELIALPLKLAGFDASPVRAVLRVGDRR